VPAADGCYNTKIRNKRKNAEKQGHRGNAESWDVGAKSNEAGGESEMGEKESG
jgi:hypothetical protein